jgi:hypothetical protein
MAVPSGGSLSQLIAACQVRTLEVSGKRGVTEAKGKRRVSLDIPARPQDCAGPGTGSSRERSKIPGQLERLCN